MRRKFILISLVFLSVSRTSAQTYADRQYVLRGEELFAAMETNSGLTLSGDGKRLQLQEGVTLGYAILKPQTCQEPFDQGLPSWNGRADDQVNGFVVQMRFPYAGSWSPWLTVGYWKDFIWGSYGATSYGGGRIDYDYVLLNDYQDKFQFKIILSRTQAAAPSPTLHKISFFTSDSRTTVQVNIPAIVGDNPPAIFIPTEFYYQYALDPDIGGSICSPTSVAMILRSYGIPVDPLQFARDTRDPYWNIFGIWPRVVQNASEYGLDGAVTRYRTWSEAYAVLAKGGRIAISVGPPLYTGHLMMLAGFTNDGRPIVHDPAKANGYGYVFNKTSLSRSWFEKGGIAYTFFPADSMSIVVHQPTHTPMPLADFCLLQNYPNPFNGVTAILVDLAESSRINLSVFDIRGRAVAALFDDWLPAGGHTYVWNASALPSGTYLVRLQTPYQQKVIKVILTR